MNGTQEIIFTIVLALVLALAFAVAIALTEIGVQVQRLAAACEAANRAAGVYRHPEAKAEQSEAEGSG